MLDRLREPLETVVRYIAPQLAAILFLSLNLQLLPILPGDGPTFAAKLVGLLFPALWLTGVGPQGLLRNGEYLMRLFHWKATRVSVTTCGLAWLVLYFATGYILEISSENNGFYRYAIYGIGHAGFMSALGIFIFLAVAREEVDPKEG